MIRKIDVNDPDGLNPWVKRSIEIFRETAYLDSILDVYPFKNSGIQRIEDKVRRELIQAHQSRDSRVLLDLIEKQGKFPYEDPVWFLLKKVKDGLANNPKQAKRIAEALYSMTAEETLIRLESQPKLNTQIGPMFGAWLRREFELLPPRELQMSAKGIFVLDATENNADLFMRDVLKQKLPKRPDLVAKVDQRYVIGEAKWIGQSGGNQEKQVKEVLSFCKNQRGEIKRVGIVDGFPWLVQDKNGRIISDKVAVLIQESEYDVISALLLKEYLNYLREVDA